MIENLSFPVRKEFRQEIIHRGGAENAEKTKDGPSLVRKAVNLGTAVVKSSAAWLQGEDWLRPEAEAAANHAKCQACPHGWYHAESDECRHPKCGCPMKRKTRWKHAHCPAWEF